MSRFSLCFPTDQGHQKTLSYLFDGIVYSDGLRASHKFVHKCLRAVLRDIEVQRLVTKESIEMIGQIVRYHNLCLWRLSYLPENEFDIRETKAELLHGKHAVQVAFLNTHFATGLGLLLEYYGGDDWTWGWRVRDFQEFQEWISRHSDGMEHLTFKIKSKFIF